MRNVPKLTPWQAFGIFSLVFGERDEDKRPSASAFKDIGVDAKARTALVKAGLLETEKVGRTTYVVLSDAGWMWAAEHLDHELPNTQKASRVLGAVLRRLGPFLTSRHAGLPDLLSPGRSEANGDLTSRVREVALAIGGGPKRRVRIAQIRRALPEVPREELDRVLNELERDKRLVLYRIDDPTDIGPEDREAVLMVAGNPRHIVYLEP
jgi:hypothetical protein